MAVLTLDPLADLMPRIASGDRSALRQLYQATSSKLFGGCLRILSDREESEDVLQEVLLAVHLKRHTWQADAPVLVSLGHSAMPAL